MQPIGIFDSGVGGLGIFRSVTQLLPYQDMVYVADNANFPFGLKTQEQMHAITQSIVSHLIKEHNVAMIIVACNTATVSSLDFLRKTFSIPFVGVVPVVKPACEQTKTGMVAIMSTPLTATSPYINDLIKQFGHAVTVTSIGCPDLVAMVEAGMVGTVAMAVYLHNLLTPVIRQGVDVIGLGCTHYPFVREQLQKVVGSDVLILDSNEPVARQAKKVFDGLAGASVPEDYQPTYRFYVTKEADKFKTVAHQLIGAPLIHDVQLIGL